MSVNWRMENLRWIETKNRSDKLLRDLIKIVVMLWRVMFYHSEHKFATYHFKKRDHKGEINKKIERWKWWNCL